MKEVVRKTQPTVTGGDEIADIAPKTLKRGGSALLAAGIALAVLPQAAPLSAGIPAQM